MNFWNSCIECETINYLLSRSKLGASVTKDKFMTLTCKMYKTKDTSLCRALYPTSSYICQRLGLSQHATEIGLTHLYPVPSMSALGSRERTFLKEHLDDFCEGQRSCNVSRVWNRLLSKFNECFPPSLNNNSDRAECDSQSLEQAACFWQSVSIFTSLQCTTNPHIIWPLGNQGTFLSTFCCVEWSLNRIHHRNMHVMRANN